MLSEISSSGAILPFSEWPCNLPALDAKSTGQGVGHRLTAYHEHDLGRLGVQSLIQSVYERAYGARITAWMPVLLGLCTDGRMQAAAGYRGAVQTLYLENYLEQPVETVLRTTCGVALPREQIVEIGHFSAVSPGGGRRLIPYLSQHLRDQGFRWAASTVGAPLYAMLRRAGYAPVPMAQADPYRLPEKDRANWGSYYQACPIVVAIDLYTPKALELSHAGH